MTDIPKFTLYGEGDAEAEQSIQPTLAFREWGALLRSEKEIAFRQLRNSGWLTLDSDEVLATIAYLNQKDLRTLPGKHLHEAGRDGSKMLQGAFDDFRNIFLAEENDALVLLMLSKFAALQIDLNDLNFAKGQTGKVRKEYIQKAFGQFDRLANALNHIFEQFAVNQLVTRNGFVPRQDEKITQLLYLPTLSTLADPKWAPVSADLAGMFDDFREQRYAEVITKAHSAVQRFLQIVVGEEGKSGKGELSKLLIEAKAKGIIPTNRFVDPIIATITGYIPSERATNSTAKPALKDTTPAEAMLMMNVVMILLQFCLQNMK